MSEARIQAVLTEADKQNPLWVKLFAHLSERLDSLRIKNDNARMTEQQTATVRGQISEVKRLMDLHKPWSEVDPEPDGK